MAKLFALDSMAILYRNYFAMFRSPMFNSKGLNTSGIFGFFNQIVKIIETEKPDYLAVVSDTSEPTFRHKQFPAYKATREKMPDDLVEQLPYLPRLVEALNLPFIVLPGFEADDIVGTLMRMCSEKNIDGRMVTSDKDYMQLITDTNIMFNHKNQKVGIKQVEDKFGCKPDQVIEILGLMGDASDNVPGVKGVGEKTAMKLIGQYGSIPDLYESIDQLPANKLKEKLIKDRELAFLSRELVTIDVNVPLDLTIEDLSLAKTDLYNNEVLISILEELEFKTFLKKVRKSSPASSTKSNKAAEKVEEIVKEKILVDPVGARCMTTMEELEAFVTEGKNAKVIAIDVIPKGDDFIGGEIEGLVLALNSTEAWYLPLSHPAFKGHRHHIFRDLKNLFEFPTITKVVYNWKHLLQLLWEKDIQSGKAILDVMLAAHLVESEERDYTLKGIISRQMQYEIKFHYSSKKPKSSEIEIQLESEGIMYQAYCEATGLLWQLADRLRAQLIQTQMNKPYEYIEIRLAEVLANVERSGVKIDSNILQKISKEFEKRLQKLSVEIFDVSGEEFNINSILDMQKILYEKLKIHEMYNVKPKKIKTGNKMSTDEETLEKMAEHPLPNLVLKYRELNKLKNTYVDQLPTFVNDDTGRIHSSFRQTAAATGRLASDNPNLQNIPIRSEEGRRIRSVFIPTDSKHILISADYSQIELRVVAHYSKDPTFLEAYRQNLDIHALTASTIFDVPEDQVDRDMRAKAKEVNFGLIYRMGPERLSLITNSSKTDAKSFIERYFLKYSTIHALHEQFLEAARKEGYARTLLGRRRYLPAINGRGLHRRMAEGAAVNTPIQGTAAEIIKLAMCSIDQRLKKEKLAAKMILTVHDELVFETPKHEKEAIIELVKHEMENVIVLEVPLIAEVGVGKNWLEAH